MFNKVEKLKLLKWVLLVLAAILFVWVGMKLVKIISIPATKESTSISKATALLILADSLTDSNPDSAEATYLHSINLLQKAENDKNGLHLLSLSYIGMANLNSETGDLKKALSNDSIAMQIALKAGDRQVLAKAYLGKGKALYRLGEYTEAINAWQQGMDLAIEINDLETQAKITSNRAMIYFYQGNIQKTIEGFTKALDIGKKLKNQQIIAGNYMNLAVVYYNLSKNDSVLSYYNYALQTYIQLNDRNGELLCYQNLGNAAYGLANFGKAIEYYELSVELAHTMNDKSNMAKGYHNLAEVYSHLGDYATANSLMFKSIKIKEQINDKLSLAKGYSGIGELFFSQNEYGKALVYFEKSLKICLEINSVGDIGSNYNNIGNIYSVMGKRDTAIAYYTKAQVYYKHTENTWGISDLYINLGSEYTVIKDYPKAEKYLLNALALKTSLKDDEGLAIANHHLADLYLMQAKEAKENKKSYILQKAEKAGIDSYQEAKKIATIPVMRDACKVLLDVYKKQGRYNEALEYSILSNSLNDSLLNKAKIQALTFAEARWNVEKKQQEINNLEMTRRLNQEIIQRKETETQQQKIIIWFIIALFLLTLISVSIYILFMRKKRDAEYQRQLAAITALRMQNARNAMSPHFFFNLLASLSGLSEHPELLKEKLNNLSLLLRKVIENIDRTAIPLTEELDAVKTYISLYRENIPEPFTVEYLIEDGVALGSLIPSMMIQIPVENAIKHGLMPIEGEKKLIISVSKTNEYQHIEIKDNGIGLNASKGLSTGTGTGLKVLLQTIHLLNSRNSNKIRFSINELKPDNNVSGTAVRIEIPFNYNYSL